MIKADQVDFQAVLPRDPTDVTELIRFECQVDECGDIVFGRRLDVHAKEAHNGRVVSVDASTAWKKSSIDDYPSLSKTST